MNQHSFGHTTLAFDGPPSDAAVAIRTPNPPRQTTTLVATGMLLAAVVAVALLLRSPTHGTSSLANTRSDGHSAAFNVFSITNGMSKAQVLRIAGQIAGYDKHGTIVACLNPKTAKNGTSTFSACR